MRRLEILVILDCLAKRTLLLRRHFEYGLVTSAAPLSHTGNQCWRRVPINQSERGEFFSDSLLLGVRFDCPPALVHSLDEFLCCRFSVGCVTASPNFARFTENHRRRRRHSRRLRCPNSSVERNFLLSAKPAGLSSKVCDEYDFKGHASS